MGIVKSLLSLAGLSDQAPRPVSAEGGGRILAAEEADRAGAGAAGWQTSIAQPEQPLGIPQPPYAMNVASVAPQIPEIPQEVAAPQNSTEQPEHVKKGGLFGALGRVVVPEPGTFWHSALTHGLFNAKAGQAAYRDENQRKELERKLLEAKVRKAETGGDYSIAGNNIVVDTPEGPVFKAPPPQPTETERLIDKIVSRYPPDQQDSIRESLIREALPGYRYSEEVVSRAGRARTDTGVAVARVRSSGAADVAVTRARAAAKYRAPAGRKASGGGVALPRGAVIER